MNHDDFKSALASCPANGGIAIGAAVFVRSTVDIPDVPIAQSIDDLLRTTETVGVERWDFRSSALAMPMQPGPNPLIVAKGQAPAGWQAEESDDLPDPTKKFFEPPPSLTANPGTELPDLSMLVKSEGDDELDEPIPAATPVLSKATDEFISDAVLEKYWKPRQDRVYVRPKNDPPKPPDDDAEPEEDDDQEDEATELSAARQRQIADAAEKCGGQEQGEDEKVYLKRVDAALIESGFKPLQKGE